MCNLSNEIIKSARRKLLFAAPELAPQFTHLFWNSPTISGIALRAIVVVLLLSCMLSKRLQELVHGEPWPVDNLDASDSEDDGDDWTPNPSDANTGV